ncbi:MAG: hypothetical protein E7551_05875 [Ruminococcaceae bacterium]|nr:hypothetical protein [Oscillospiraceae bacterium]
MNNRELEGKIKNAVEKSTPDVWERVQNDISYGKGEIVTMSDKKRKSKIVGIISSVAAALVLISAAVFGITNYNKADLKPVSTIYLEVNPQIELSLNTYNKVLEATPRNEDGKKVLGDMNLKNTELDVALNAVLGSMVKNGYLTKDANSVLISVEHETLVKANYLNIEVLESVENNGFGFATVVQTVENNNELKSEAKKLNITSGKAKLIRTIKENGVKASEEDLSKLSVHELNLILQSHINEDNKDESINNKGTANKGEYISAEKAKEIALKAANVKENSVTDLEIDFDYDFGKMVYEVEFEAGNKEYDYELDAVSGEILKSHTEGKNSKNETSSKPANSSKPSSNSDIISSNKIDAVIAPEKALEIAISHAGVDKNRVSDVKSEIDLEDNSRYCYEVEFKANGYEYEYEIDAVSGKVLESKKELDD